MAPKINPTPIDTATKENKTSSPLSLSTPKDS